MSRTALYSDADLVKAQPYLPTMIKSIQAARPRPEAVRYGDVTATIQERRFAALQDGKSPQQALADLQAKLGPLTTE